MKLVTVKDLSAYLNVKESTLYSWAYNGKIPFCHLNGLIRFDMEEIERWVKTSKQVSIDSNVRSKKTKNRDIDRIVKKAIDSTKNNRYNHSNGKPGQIQGLREEA